MSFEFVFSVNTGDSTKDLIVSIEKIRDEDYCKVKIYENLDFTGVRRKIKKFSKTSFEDVRDFLMVKIYGSENIRFNYYTFQLNSIDSKRYNNRQISQSIEKFCDENDIQIMTDNHNNLLRIVEIHEYKLKRIQNNTDKARSLTLLDIKNFVDLLFTFLRDTAERKNKFDSIIESTGLEVAF